MGVLSFFLLFTLARRRVHQYDEERKEGFKALAKKRK